MHRSFTLIIEWVPEKDAPILVRVGGRLDANNALRLDQVLAPLREGTQPDHRLILDMSGVPSVEPQGLSVLVRTRRLLDEQGARLVLHGCQPAVKDLLESTRLSKLFEVETPSSPGAEARDDASEVFLWKIV